MPLDGARTGAPDAVQVADRFRLWQNLAKAVEKCVAAHRSCLAGPPPPPARMSRTQALPEPEDTGQPDPAGRYAERTRRHHALVHGLRAEGRGLREIARHLGWGLHTVQRLDRAATWQELADGRWQGPRPSKLDPFKPYLDQHADGAHGSIRRLFGEIKALGYNGSYPVVRDYLARTSPAREPLPPGIPLVAARAVVCQVTAPARNGLPAGPVGRAKGLLDALHDNRRNGPFYRDLGTTAPLSDDDPAHVAALAVEVAIGQPRTRYTIGTGLRTNGHLIATVPVPSAAPNDIAASPAEQARISTARDAYGKAVRSAFAQHAAPPRQHPAAVVIRHWPQRDADNTWRTWINAICGATRASQDHWAASAPLAGWRPTAIASILDTTIATPVTYELWA